MQKIVLGVCIVLILVLSVLCVQEHMRKESYIDFIDDRCRSAFGQFCDRMNTTDVETDPDVYYAEQTQSLAYCLDLLQVPPYEDYPTLSKVISRLYLACQQQDLGDKLTPELREAIIGLNWSFDEPEQAQRVLELLEAIYE